MERLRLDRTSRVPYTAELFTGNVHRQPLIGGASKDVPVPSEHLSVQLIAFDAGARTHLHTHTVDQVLIITEGTGYVGTRDSAFRVSAGDIIHVPAGEPHFHGGSRREAMAHLSLLTPGTTTIVDTDFEPPDENET